MILMLAWAAAPGWAQKIQMKSGQFDPLAGPVVLRGLPSEKAAGAKPASATLQAGEKRLVLVQWAGGLSNEKLKYLKSLGGVPLLPMPISAYLALVPAGLDLGGLSKTSAGANAPRWAAAMAPEWKLDPRVAAKLAELAKAAPGTATLGRYFVQFALTGEEKGTRVALRTLGRSAALHSSWKNFETWIVEAQPSAVEALARLNSVFWIEPFIEKKPMGERSGYTIANMVNSTGSDISKPGMVKPASYSDWLAQVGLSGKDVIVQVMDSGLSQGKVNDLDPQSAHPDLFGRIVGIDNATLDPLGNDASGHGTLNTSIILGQPLAGGGGMRDAGGYLLGQGIAPNAMVFATKMLDNQFIDYQANNPVPRSLDSLVEVGYAAGARISSNSWGTNGTTPGVDMSVYDVYAQLFDRLTRDASNIPGDQPMIFAFAAGNAGLDGSMTISSPATAKNVISVGAGESSDSGAIDGSLDGPQDADDIRDAAVFSSRGPTIDGRLGVTLMAPGTHVTGAATDDPAFNGLGVAGRLQVEANEVPTAKLYYPAGQKFYTWSSGTSHATPAVAGALALLYEYCQKTYHRAPSPALAKAMLISSAVDTAGGNRNFLITNSVDKLPSIPNNDAGWGRCSLAGLVDHTRNQFLIDQPTTQTLTYSGQSISYDVQVADPTQPFKVVLAWSDPPASTGAVTALVNDLDLEVTNGLYTWHGNVFSGGNSVTGGAPDHVNNTESVFLAKPTPGVYTVKITAFNLAGDALPDRGEDIEQDFALFASSGKALSTQAQIAFDQAYYTSGDAATVLLNDLDLKGKGTANVTVTSLNMKDSEVLTLTEAPPSSGFFRGTLPMVYVGKATVGDHQLTVCNKETIRATCSDNGGVSRSVQALVDIKPPTMLSQTITRINVDSARIKILSDEPTSVTIYYSTLPTGFKTALSKTALATEHEMYLTPLKTNTPYFYLIRLTDQAGNSATYDNDGALFAFQTKQRNLDYVEQFETGSPGWKHSAAVGLDDWITSTTYADYPNNHAWTTRDVNVIKDASLVSPPIALKPNSTMSFWQWYKFQAVANSPFGRNLGFDGAVVEMTKDNGTSWQDLGPYNQMGLFTLPFISSLDPTTGLPSPIAVYWTGIYDTILSTGTYNPMGGRQAWSGRSWDKIIAAAASPAMVTANPLLFTKNSFSDTSASLPLYSYFYPAAYDLSSFAGQTVQFRFRIGCDNKVGAGRWILDDFSVTSPENGVTSMSQIAFDQPLFNGGQTRIRFTLSDIGLSSSTGTMPTDFKLLLNYDATTGDPIYIPALPFISDMKLIDDRGIWEGYLTVAPDTTKAKTVTVASIVTISEGQSVKLLYQDPDVGDGVTPYWVSASTTLDWTPPTLKGNDVSMVHNHDFLISLKASEPVKVTVRTGPSISNLLYTYTADDLAADHAILIENLLADTPYYYTVQLTDAAGNTTTFDNSGFGFGVRTLSYVWQKDTMEPDSERAFDWTHEAADPSMTDIWTMVDNQVYHSPTHSWFGVSTSHRNDSSLYLPPVNIREGYRLRFWHFLRLDPGLDGAVIEISTDNGATFQDLGPNIIGGIPYNYVISWAFGSPIAGRNAWSGTPVSNINSAGEVTVDLSPYAGNGRLIRFRLACDTNARSATGWYVDDVTIDEYGPSTQNFPSKPTLSAPANGSRNLPYTADMLLKWGAAKDASAYRVWFGTDPKNLVSLFPGNTQSTNAQISEPSLIPGTTYYWRIDAINDIESKTDPRKVPMVAPSDLQSFKIKIIEPTSYVNQLLGKSPGLTALEKVKGDFNGDGVIDISDMLNNLKRK